MCFPEATPWGRGQDFEVLPFDRTQQERALQAVSQWARTYAVATILGMERLTEAGRQIAAFVIDARGQLQGYQTKNQLDPTEDRFYVPGQTRRLFEINGMKFGVAICHEGWRYPETVRWAAVRGAKIVFHPQHTGSERDGVRLTQWGAAGAPYYEKAMMMRSIENTIYFASVNYALALPGIGDEPDRPVGPVPGVSALRPGRRAGAGHRRRGGDRVAGHAIRARALSRIHDGVSGQPSVWSGCRGLRGTPRGSFVAGRFAGRFPARARARWDSRSRAFISGTSVAFASRQGGRQPDRHHLLDRVGRGGSGDSRVLRLALTVRSARCSANALARSVGAKAAGASRIGRRLAGRRAVLERVDKLVSRHRSRRCHSGP